MCNEKLNLVKLLSGCPKGTKLYSPIIGEAAFLGINIRENYPIRCEFGNKHACISFTSEGLYFSKEEDSNGECMLFPSKECRDWSKFTPFKDGDILANEDGRAFIFRGKFNEDGYPIAHGGVDKCDMFIESEDDKVWSKGPFRRATTKEVENMICKMKEVGYIWDDKQKGLKKDLPIDTMVAVCDSYSSTFYFHSMAVRRYAGNHSCFNNNGGSRSCDTISTTKWRHIIPLDKLIVNKEGIVELNKVTDYGTYNYYA